MLYFVRGTNCHLCFAMVVLKWFFSLLANYFMFSCLCFLYLVSVLSLGCRQAFAEAFSCLSSNCECQQMTSLELHMYRKGDFCRRASQSCVCTVLHVCMWAFQSSLREVHCVWTRVAEHFGLIKDKLHRRMSACEGELTPEGASELIGKWINHFTVVLNFIQCNIAYLNRYCSFTDTITPSKS